ncbi:MAG: hypothetical protein JWP38_913 [Herbaspirillum sp.]|nr:hypothetical protein [Herbaspirillum sp.]
MAKINTTASTEQTHIPSISMADNEQEGVLIQNIEATGYMLRELMALADLAPAPDKRSVLMCAADHYRDEFNVAIDKFEKFHKGGAQ